MKKRVACRVFPINSSWSLKPFIIKSLKFSLFSLPLNYNFSFSFKRISMWHLLGHVFAFFHLHAIHSLRVICVGFVLWISVFSRFLFSICICFFVFLTFWVKWILNIIKNKRKITSLKLWAHALMHTLNMK